MLPKLPGFAAFMFCILSIRVAHAQNFAKLPVSADSSYGHLPTNPIRLRKGDMGHSIANSVTYLNGLRTKDNQSLQRIARTTINDPAYEKPAIQLTVKATGLPASGRLGLLDKYTFLTSSTKDTVVLYVDIYNRGLLALPAGFKYEQGLQ